MAKSKRKPKPKAPPPATGTRAGVPNHDRPVVASLPAACPSCQCTEARVEGRRDERHLKGTLQGAKPGQRLRFNRVVWQPVVCEACGQHFKRRTYHYDPPPEKCQTT